MNINPYHFWLINNFYTYFSYVCDSVYHDDLREVNAKFYLRYRGNNYRMRVLKAILDENEHPICRVFADRDRKVAVVAFRGTNNIMDWRTNLNARLSSFDFAGSEIPNVHTGFYRVLDQKPNINSNATLYDCIIMRLHRVIYNKENNERRIFITGHSLGGALAVLFATRLETQYPGLVREVLTFGQPAVGGSQFKEFYPLKNRTHRFCLGMDIVTFLPPAFYRHVGSQFWIINKAIYPYYRPLYRIIHGLNTGNFKFISDHSRSSYLYPLSTDFEEPSQIIGLSLPSS